MRCTLCELPVGGGRRGWPSRIPQGRGSRNLSCRPPFWRSLRRSCAPPPFLCLSWLFCLRSRLVCDERVPGWVQRQIALRCVPLDAAERSGCCLCPQVQPRPHRPLTFIEPLFWSSRCAAGVLPSFGCTVGSLGSRMRPSGCHIGRRSVLVAASGRQVRRRPHRWLAFVSASVWRSVRPLGRRLVWLARRSA